ncbi:MAG: bifunctional DNA-formamidopyrimidine glycosylase/DNA-(apurinic or apyrimidinic site) lyase [Anaerolineae bacterium]|nr:bifunctional DNA-formamidopyrimidine glycosylase/DNA-(apurinic or apyrimidinic site) lyase [Anaerolineae bacterium]
MPELPEVETIVRELRPHIVGRTIRDVSVDWARIIASPREDVEGFRAGLRGRRIERAWRRAKFVVLSLDDGWSLIVHLRMSGRLMLAPVGRPEHLRVVLALSSGALHFYCQRKFGRIWLVEDPQTVLGDLGPEPLSDAFTFERFAALLRGRRGMLKPLLLNQRFIAGLGNIYTDESLFRAGLHPCRRADTLDDDEIARLHGAIRAVLQQALDHHGTTFDGIYVRPQGEEGRQQEGLSVYGQAGAPCPRCGGAIERIVVAQRGTHICPSCQPLLGQGEP